MPFEGEVGNEYSVLITEMAHDGISLVGHNKYYDQILIRGNVDVLMGKRVDVRITSVTKHSMLAEVIGEPVNPALSVNRQVEREKEEEKMKTKGECNHHGNVAINDNPHYVKWASLGGIVLLGYIIYRRIK